MIQKTDKKKVPFIDDWMLVSVACLTLGLAPFFPEPHLWGKIRWLWGGGTGMQPIDYFDFVWHLWPWILFIRLAGLYLFSAFFSGNSFGKK